ncbi:hypothetical protein DVH24_034719 [Malus domestica]|uniref:Uncharacterized protein n=1 Tax=Malus domestica TaxID=3750 RepID=A0A498IWP1_MALDO|nr:hypothetical protein DVH24_034719 [Malus domestica]
MDLSHSMHLTEVPDLSQCPKIKHINLMKCTSLVEIPSYFVKLDKLTVLNLGYCSLRSKWNHDPEHTCKHQTIFSVVCPLFNQMQEAAVYTGAPSWAANS